MDLKKYNEKRDFKNTGEPQAGEPKHTSPLQFVIQKHAASQLHYDFRLEMNGVLKSWAVPKGPSSDPQVKRLAMMVEDHPFDYKDFEGIIPKGEYGGGTVMVWDKGSYEPIEPIKGKKKQEKNLISQLDSGSLKFILHGKKLKGEFALVKTKGMGKNSWLLIKHKDEYASSTDITKLDQSVLSNKTLQEIEKDNHSADNNDAEIPLKGAQKKTKKSAVPRSELAVRNKNPNEIPDLKSLLRKGHRSSRPAGVKPMLATLVDHPFDDPEWLYEVKWDGYRTLASCSKSGEVQLLSRNTKSFNDQFYPIHQALAQWKIDLVIDGEVVVLDSKGISNFGDLQRWSSQTDGDLVYYVFDILWYDGMDLTSLPLRDRQTLLENLLPKNDDRVRLSEVFKAKGKEFFDAASKLGLEGIIAKKSSSRYVVNTRSKEWLKIKIQNRQEIVICGFTKNKDSPKPFSSLLMGVYQGSSLHYVGKVGTGFSEKEQKELMTKLKPLERKKSPFSTLPEVNQPSRFAPHPPDVKVFWIQPKLVAEVAYTEITKEGVFRHPSFKGLRMDKEAKEVVQDSAVKTEVLVDHENKTNSDTTSTQKALHEQVLHSAKPNERKTLLNPTEETQVRKVNGHALKFTHLNKLYWPEDHISKRDLFNYYHQVAEFILPYLKDRPMSLNRYPGGIHSKSFYQKNIKNKAPKWAETFPYHSSDGEEKEYLLGKDEATLLWMVSLGCIEMNPWFSRKQSPDHPDYCVVDLDPDKNTFDQVIQVARLVKELLDQLQVPCYLKTSGSTGMHIYIPLGAKYSYNQSQKFAELIVNMVHMEVPKFTSLERIVSKREGKMYLDFLQNRPGATIAGAYSLRPKPGATVSMPLDWEEVKPGLSMHNFTIFNAIDRLKDTGDLFKGVLGKGINLEKAIQNME